MAEASAAPVQRKAKTIPQPVVEHAADRSTLAEQHQQCKAHDHRGQYERQVDDRVDQRLPRKGKARQPIRDEDRERKAEDDAYDRDPKT